MTINYKFFEKESMEGFMKKQFLPSFVLITFGAYLVQKEVSPIYSFFVLWALYFYSYYSHVVVHWIPKTINPHLLHHTDDEIPFLLNLAIEGSVNTFFFVLLYYAQLYAGVEIFPPILILYYCIIYVSVHLINFSIFGKEKNHEKHHHAKDMKFCNYGPDTIDHFLGTNCDKTWADHTHYFPNILASFYICYFIYKKKEAIQMVNTILKSLYLM